MKVTLNNKEFELEEASTLEDLLTKAQIKPQGIATALNGAVVPASMRDKKTLCDGDSIVVITAFYGG